MMDYNTKAGVLGGTFFSTISNIGVEDVVTTCILAVAGAVVSFLASVVLKCLLERLKSKLKK